MREQGRKGRFGTLMPPCAASLVLAESLWLLEGAGVQLQCLAKGTFPHTHTGTPGTFGAGKGLCCLKPVHTRGCSALAMLLAGCWEAASAHDTHFSVWVSN